MDESTAAALKLLETARKSGPVNGASGDCGRDAWSRPGKLLDAGRCDLETAENTWRFVPELQLNEHLRPYYVMMCNSDHYDVSHSHIHGYFLRFFVCSTCMSASHSHIHGLLPKQPAVPPDPGCDAYLRT